MNVENRAAQVHKSVRSIAKMIEEQRDGHGSGEIGMKVLLMEDLFEANKLHYLIYRALSDTNNDDVTDGGLFTPMYATPSSILDSLNVDGLTADDIHQAIQEMMTSIYIAEDSETGARLVFPLLSIYVVIQPEDGREPVYLTIPHGTGGALISSSYRWYREERT